MADKHKVQTWAEGWGEHYGNPTQVAEYVFIYQTPLFHVDRIPTWGITHVNRQTGTDTVEVLPENWEYVNCG